jgi:hypothetical protein
MSASFSTINITQSIPTFSGKKEDWKIYKDSMENYLAFLKLLYVINPKHPLAIIPDVESGKSEVSVSNMETMLKKSSTDLAAAGKKGQQVREDKLRTYHIIYQSLCGNKEIIRKVRFVDISSLIQVVDDDSTDTKTVKKEASDADADKAKIKKEVQATSISSSSSSSSDPATAADTSVTMFGYSSKVVRKGEPTDLWSVLCNMFESDLDSPAHQHTEMTRFYAANLRPNEKLVDFAARLRYSQGVLISMGIPVHEKTLKYQLIQGIKNIPKFDQPRSYLMMQGTKSFDDAVSVLSAYEDNSNVPTVTVSHAQMPIQNGNDQVNDQVFFVKGKPYRRGSRPSFRGGSDRGRSFRGRSDKTNIQCFNCKNYGHIAAECHQKKNQSSPPNSGYFQGSDRPRNNFQFNSSRGRRHGQWNSSRGRGRANYSSQNDWDDLDGEMSHYSYMVQEQEPQMQGRHRRN